MHPQTRAAMKIRISLTAAAMVLAACGARQPQNGPGPVGSGRDAGPRDSLQRELFAAYRGAQMPSVYALIGARERLKLTSTQVTALDSIAEAVREQNRPFADSLGRFTRTGSGGPIRVPSNDAPRRDFIVILQRMGENNRRGVAAIQALLDADQRAGACTLAAEERQGRFGRTGGRGDMGGGGGRGGGGRGGMRGRGMPEMMGDSIGGRGMGFGGWPWCGAPRGRGMSSDSSRA
jgi:hypothetical protein